MFTIVVIVNGVKEIVKVVATTIFSAFDAAERQTGGVAIGKVSEKGQTSAEFAMLAIAFVVVIIAVVSVILPFLTEVVKSSVPVVSTLNALGQ